MHKHSNTCIKTFLLALLTLVCVFSTALRADVVKPVLIEIVAQTNGEVSIEIRASIEAFLSGINGQYSNTQQAPTAAQYDQLRALKPAALQQAFHDFIPTFLSAISLQVDNRKIPLTLATVDIPEPGYTQVPRISTVHLIGKIPRHSQSLQWYFPAAFGDNAVRVKQANLDLEQWHWSAWQWIRNDQPSTPFSLTRLFPERAWWNTTGEYIQIGFEHIIPRGLDHIVFVLGLVLFSIKVRPLLWQVTMFTVAHTLTLGLAMYGLINLPANIVEPLIALSIAYIGIENCLTQKLQQKRLILVFLFGLLHGLGFAGALNDFGLPDKDFALALVSFNIGVELGQLSIIATAIILIYLLFKSRMGIYRRYIAIPTSMMIGITGLYWAAQRLEWL